MSSDQAVNAESIEQTKQQIRGLVSEIAQLSKSDLEADQYYAAFLQRIVDALAALGGAVWIMTEGRRLDLAYQIKISETLLDTQSEDASRHFGLLNHVAATGEPRLVPPLSGAADEQSAGNPTSNLLVLAPLKSDNQIEGVVEVFQRPDAQPVTQRGYLKFVVQMCELAGEWLKTRKLRQISNRHSLWAEADQFSRIVHENLDLRETAYTVVNEGRRMIGCDRVSVGIMHGRKCRIEAVSGQDTIENRSNIVNFLGQVATRVVATGESLWYDGSTEDLPPQVEKALDNYVDESHTKMLAVLPVRRPKRPEDVRQTVTGEADQESNLANEIVGALIVEQIESSLPEEVLRSRTDLVYEHSARALTNSLDHSRIFLMPVWRAVGKMKWAVKARTMPKSVMILGAIFVLLVAMFVFRKDFNLQANGALQPVEKRDVFVAVDGDVIEVLVEDQDPVEAGDLLVRLRNTDLEVEFKDVLGQYQAKTQRMFSVQYALNDQENLSEVEKIRLGGEKRELEQELKILEEQYELLNTKKERLEIRAPISGEVMMSWDVQKSLLRRPVTTGQILMTVADTSKDWELELYMREGRAGHVRRTRNDEQLCEKYPGAGENVTYILATDPGTYRHGKIKDIKGGTELHQEEGHIVKMKVDIDGEEIGNPHPGATVTADVYCGRRAIGYVWFHEAWEWVQANIFFYLA
jgi:hypothetical protein